MATRGRSTPDRSDRPRAAGTVGTGAPRAALIIAFSAITHPLLLAATGATAAAWEDLRTCRASVRLARALGECWQGRHPSHTYRPASTRRCRRSPDSRPGSGRPACDGQDVDGLGHQGPRWWVRILWCPTNLRVSGDREVTVAPLGVPPRYVVLSAVSAAAAARVPGSRDARCSLLALKGTQRRERRRRHRTLVVNVVECTE